LVGGYLWLGLALPLQSLLWITGDFYGFAMV